MENQICAYIKDKINIDNVSTVYYSSQLFKFSSMFKISLCYIERCFLMVSDKKSFLELKFMSVAKVFSSSNLNTDWELEVVKAAERWLCHKRNERTKYAKYLLLKTRLSLLSDSALNYIKDKVLCFKRNGMVMVMVSLRKL